MRAWRSITRKKARLQADLGQNNFLMLHNHGLLTCAGSIADTFLMMFTFQRACEIQAIAQSGGTGAARTSSFVATPGAVLGGRAG